MLLSVGFILKFKIASEISDQTVIPKVVDTQVEHSIKTRSGRHVKPTNRIDL